MDNEYYYRKTMFNLEIISNILTKLCDPVYIFPLIMDKYGLIEYKDSFTFCDPTKNYMREVRIHCKTTHWKNNYYLTEEILIKLAS